MFLLKKTINLFLLLIIILINGQEKVYSLEQTVLELNNKYDFRASQDILLNILDDNFSTDKEKFEASILLSNTYKRVDDYRSVFRYLDITKKYCKTEEQFNTLEALEAIGYFNTKHFEYAKKAMKHLKEKDYQGIEFSELSILIMQEGYFSFLDKKYTKAEQQYKESLELMKQINSCQIPLVYGKMLALYHETNNNEKLIETYKKAKEQADKCKQIQCKIYLIEEYVKVLDKDDYKQQAVCRKELDSLKSIYTPAKYISQLHDNEKKHNKLKKESESKINYIIFGGSILIIILIILYTIFVYKKRKLIEKENLEIRNALEKHLISKTKIEQDTLLKVLNEDLFTDRQKIIFDELLKGKNNIEIAEKLFITENTVKYHIKKIYKILKDNDIEIDRNKIKTLD